MDLNVYPLVKIAEEEGWKVRETLEMMKYIVSGYFQEKSKLTESKDNG